MHRMTSWHFDDCREETPSSMVVIFAHLPTYLWFPQFSILFVFVLFSFILHSYFGNLRVCILTILKPLHTPFRSNPFHYPSNSVFFPFYF
ncbi:mCG1051103 [Mus musculus]|nr:mCG1051103 [Mus musculus]